MNISKPTKDQLVHGAERALLAFVTASAVFLRSSHNPVSKDALSGAFVAGAVAVYQLVLSTLTSH